jgi:hypothetical protein
MSPVNEPSCAEEGRISGDRLFVWVHRCCCTEESLLSLRALHIVNDILHLSNEGARQRQSSGSS